MPSVGSIIKMCQQIKFNLINLWFSKLQILHLKTKHTLHLILEIFEMSQLGGLLHSINYSFH